MSYQPTIPHPINEKIVKRARHEHERDQDNIEDLEDVHSVLDKTQEQLQERLKGLHQEAVLGSERISAWGETEKGIGDRYVFVGSLERFWKKVFESADITEYSVQQMVKDAHRLQAETYGVKNGTDAVIVAKPIVWRHGQSAARTELRHLLERGLTPAEAVDLWYTEYEPHTITQSNQADMRGISQQAVNKNVTNAKQKLDPQQTGHLSSLDPH